MHYGGLGPIRIIKGTVDGLKYRKIIEECILPHSEEIKIFQQDNAPPHKTIINMQLLEKHVEVLKWPPYSPDLNPIENLWAILKRKVAKRRASSLAELQEAIIDIWHNDSDLVLACKSLVESMPKRISALLKSRGGFTKY